MKKIYLEGQTLPNFTPQPTGCIEMLPGGLFGEFLGRYEDAEVFQITGSVHFDQLQKVKEELSRLEKANRELYARLTK